MGTFTSTSVPRSFLAAAAFLAVAWCGWSASAQTTIHVAPCGDDSWTGASDTCAAPDGPKRTIQAAIDGSINGDTVLIADGVYTGNGNRVLNVVGKDITVRSENGPFACIIDCQASQSAPHRAFLFQNGADSIIEGFTVRNGYPPRDLEPEYGGAVLSRYSSPVIRNCTFCDNQASVGGVMLVRGGNLNLMDCTFCDNTAAAGGGAIWSEIDSNGHGVVANCTFLRNRTLSPDLRASGALNAINGEYTIRNCNFTNNSSARIASCVELVSTLGTVTDCVFIGNVAAKGGALAVAADSSATVSNCLFSQNRITGGDRPASALWIGDGLGGPSHADVINCTFSLNNAPSNSAALFVTQTSSASVSNCVLWNNTPAPISKDPGATATVSFSDVQGGWPGPGSDNIDQDPLFADPASDNCRLEPFSPCIDRGSNSAVPPGTDTDLDGLQRFVDDPWMPNRSVPPVDMGAYEFQGNSCHADFNNNGVLNSQDLFDFLDAFFETAAEADFNRDGAVNSQDFFDFLAAFFQGCS